MSAGQILNPCVFILSSKQSHLPEKLYSLSMQSGFMLHCESL